VCRGLQQFIVGLLQLAIKKEVREEKDIMKGEDSESDYHSCDAIIEERLDAGQIILNSKEVDRLTVKLLIEKALNDIKKIEDKSTDDYMVAENEEDPHEIAVLKKGNIEQLGVFICEFCPLVFRSDIEKNIHQRIHFFGIG
jgi:hypothetical protein